MVVGLELRGEVVVLSVVLRREVGAVSLWVRREGLGLPACGLELRVAGPGLGVSRVGYGMALKANGPCCKMSASSGYTKSVSSWSDGRGRDRADHKT